MKKLMMGAALWAVAALASATNVVNPPVNVNGNVGSVQVSQCASVAGNCNNPDMTVNFTGDVDKVYVDGRATVIKGKDGKDGKDGINGTNGKDGINGTNGVDGKTVWTVKTAGTAPLVQQVRTVKMGSTVQMALMALMAAMV